MRQIRSAKIDQPSAAGTFPRRRLFHLIDKKLTRPVLWIAGPPGSGKTTLVSSYIAAKGFPSLWYQVDASDRDIASFFYYLGLAARKIAPHQRQPLPILTPEYLKDIPTFTRLYFEKFFSRLLDRSPVRVILVFDNYQAIPERSLFHETIQHGLSEVPAGINVIIISRQDPPNHFTRMRANRTMELIEWDELKFNFDESKRMVRHLGHKRLPNELLQQLHERTGGWVAGLVLLTGGIKAGGAKSLLSRTGVTDEIFRYFAGEIFSKTSKETQDFLLKTSFFKRMTPPMAEALTGNAKAKRILSDLSQKHYFTQRHESPSLFFQYHPLFREFLKEQGKEYFRAEELTEIERRASVILADHGQIEDAAYLMAKTGNWSALIPLILNNAPALISQGRNQTLEGWVCDLPQSQRQKNPWLLYWLGVCRLPFSPVESGRLFEKAFNLFRKRRDPAGIYLSLAGLFDSTTYGMENFKAYDRWIDLLAEIRKEYETFPSEEIEARLTASVTYALVARRPEFPEVEEWAERAFFLVKRSPDLFVKTRTLQALASHYLFMGDYSKAALIINSFKEVAQSPYLPPLLTILLKTLEALYHWRSGSFKECRKAVTDGLDLGSSTGVHLWDSFLLGHGAARALSEGDVNEAREFLQKMSPSLSIMPLWGKEFYHVLEAWFSLIRGDLQNALSHIELSLAFSNETGMLPTKPFAHLGKALILIELQREKEAQDQIDQVRAMLQSSRAPLPEFMVLLAQAQLALNMKNEASGLDSLRKALSLGKEQGYSNTFFWHAPVMVTLLKRALDANIEVDYVQRLIRKRDLSPDSPPYDCDRWPWPLEIFTLGRFDLVKDGDPLEFPVKTPRKMLSFLKALVASGSKGLSEEQLTANLWSEAEGDMAHQAFATSLHRLRLLLGNEKAIQLRKGLLRFDGHFCWVDAHAFEYLLQQADALNDPPLLQKAINLYTGPFLGGDDSDPWAMSYQEKLRSKFLRAVTKLGKFFEEREEQEKAIECYRKGLEVDEFGEVFCQRLMLCYHASGRKAEALSIYDRFCKRIQSVLGVNPSPKTQAIYETVR
jgi:ATP/maltotriose-dependent transcriptional regulator MalT/DNA-binding SARP family transcriptional activator